MNNNFLRVFVFEPLQILFCLLVIRLLNFKLRLKLGYLRFKFFCLALKFRYLSFKRRKLVFSKLKLLREYRRRAMFVD